jgi:hypothetical protein
MGLPFVAILPSEAKQSNLSVGRYYSYKREYPNELRSQVVLTLR